MSKEAKTNKSRSKGPIRFEAIIPIAIILGLIWGYSVFFLDGHIRRAIEYVASRFHGAEVNVASLRLSFTEPSITVEGIELTNKDNPKQNIVAIDRIRFALIWDALLRAKIAISESSLNGLSLYSPRKNPGEVYPPPPPKPDTEPSVSQKISTELKAEAEAKTKNNIFGDIANVLGGTDASSQLSQIRDQLQAEAKIKELQSSLNSKKSEWTKKIDELPKPEAAKAVLDKIRATKIDFSNPATAKSQLESVKADIAKVDEMVKAYQSGQKNIEQDIASFNASLKEIDEATRKDLEALQSRLKIPSIDKDSITKSLLSQVLGDKLLKLTAFIDKAKAYIPDRKDDAKDEKPEFVPHPRSNGRTYKFPVTTGYPMFWLKKAELSSKSTPDGFSGDFDGKILNVTTDPKLIGSPTVVEMGGNAPKQELKDIKMRLVLDYRGKSGTGDLDLAVGSHPMPEQSFVNSSDVTFALQPSTASLKSHAKFTGSDLDAKIEETISQPIFKTSAKSSVVDEALKTAVGRIKQLSMKITLAGNFSNQKIGLDSNLGSELAAGLQAHVKEKLEQTRAKLKSFVDGRIGSERAKVTAEYTKLQGSFSDLLKGKDGEFKNLQSELQKALKDKTKLDSDKSKKDLEKKAKDLFQKVKI